jgi:hypothetical protein
VTRVVPVTARANSGTLPLPPALSVPALRSAKQAKVHEVVEATWGDGAKTPAIDWRMSVSLEDVPRGDGDVAEVTSLESAVRAWSQLDPAHKQAATLKLERPIHLDGVSLTTFAGDGIAALVEKLPA